MTSTGAQELGSPPTRALLGDAPDAAAEAAALESGAVLAEVLEVLDDEHAEANATAPIAAAMAMVRVMGFMPLPGQATPDVGGLGHSAIL